MLWFLAEILLCEKPQIETQKYHYTAQGHFDHFMSFYNNYQDVWPSLPNIHWIKVLRSWQWYDKINAKSINFIKKIYSSSLCWQFIDHMFQGLLGYWDNMATVGQKRSVIAPWYIDKGKIIKWPWTSNLMMSHKLTKRRCCSFPQE